MEDITETIALRNRVFLLERQVEQLRVSRRVLMALVEKLENEKRQELLHLARENRKLQYNNKKYAKWLMQKNYRLAEISQKSD